ncbi:MAG: UPF0236 family protein [Candidatus Omnitrophota bacterium]
MDTISIAFPSVKINVKIDEISFDSIEQMVFDIAQRIGRKAIEKALFDVDDALRNNRPEGTLENAGKREKHFMTRMGDIRYERTRYLDKSTGKSRYLLEEKLGIAKNQRISLMRSKMEMLIATMTTYRATGEHAELLTGCKRSHESLRQSVIREAERIIAYQESSINRTRNLKDDTGPGVINDVAYVESDSAFIRQQRKRTARGRSQTLRRRKRKSIEVKLGIGYTDKVRRYERGRGKSLKLKDKFTYASVESGSTFMEKLSLIAEKKLNLSMAKTIICGGDGGAYITAGIRDYFVNAIYILCKFHLKRNIKRCLASWPKTQDKLNALLGKDKIDKALSLLRAISRRARDKRVRQSVDDLHTYIDHNRDGINPLNRIKDKALRDKVKGAGAMESNVDKFLAHRFKKRGMSWSITGALSLIKVKETIANGDWDSWWLEGRDEKIEINTEPLKQLTAKDFWKIEKNDLPLIEADIPALQGPERNEPWAKVVREIQNINYYKYAGFAG